MFGTKPHHFGLDFFAGFQPSLLAAVSSYDILVPAYASELGNRADAILEVIYIFKLQSIF